MIWWVVSEELEVEMECGSPDEDRMRDVRMEDARFALLPPLCSVFKLS